MPKVAQHGRSVGGWGGVWGIERRRGRGQMPPPEAEGRAWMTAVPAGGQSPTLLCLAPSLQDRQVISQNAPCFKRAWDVCSGACASLQDAPLQTSLGGRSSVPSFVPLKAPKGPAHTNLPSGKSKSHPSWGLVALAPSLGGPPDSPSQAGLVPPPLPGCLAAAVN